MKSLEQLNRKHRRVCRETQWCQSGFLRASWGSSVCYSPRNEAGAYARRLRKRSRSRPIFPMAGVTFSCCPLRHPSTRPQRIETLSASFLGFSLSRLLAARGSCAFGRVVKLRHGSARLKRCPDTKRYAPRTDCRSRAREVGKTLSRAAE